VHEVEAQQLEDPREAVARVLHQMRPEPDLVAAELGLHRPAAEVGVLLDDDDAPAAGGEHRRAHQPSRPGAHHDHVAAHGPPPT
jgi:hypothetical protein